MSLRFFADQCVSKYIIDKLAEVGYEVLIVRDFIPVDSPDPIVIQKAQELEAVLLSLNGDFSDIVSYPPEHDNGIIAIQVKNHPKAIPLIVERLKLYLSSYPEMSHYKGKLFLVEAHRIRLRE
jgi:predicted nuclease of predicted toxin-antitoxin system